MCFWSDSKQMFTIFLVPPLIHTQKTYTSLTLYIVIHILFHTSLITNDSCRTTKHYHIKQRYTAITASLTLITPLIGRINTSARSQHTSRDRIDPPGHTPADLHPLISSRRRHSVAVSSLDYVSHQLPGLLHQLHPAVASIHQAFAIRPVNLHNDPTTAAIPFPNHIINDIKIR